MSWLITYFIIGLICGTLEAISAYKDDRFVYSIKDHKIAFCLFFFTLTILLWPICLLVNYAERKNK